MGNAEGKSEAIQTTYAVLGENEVKVKDHRYGLAIGLNCNFAQSKIKGHTATSILKFEITRSHIVTCITPKLRRRTNDLHA